MILYVIFGIIKGERQSTRGKKSVINAFLMSCNRLGPTIAAMLAVLVFRTTPIRRIVCVFFNRADNTCQAAIKPFDSAPDGKERGYSYLLYHVIRPFNFKFICCFL